MECVRSVLFIHHRQVAICAVQGVSRSKIRKLIGDARESLARLKYAGSSV